MSPGGGIYHFGEKVRFPTARAVGATIAGQEAAPIFKLVCPDGTGGSRECCIENRYDTPYKINTGSGETTVTLGRSTIGDVGESVSVANRLVKHPVAQGSYNYAETMTKGLPAHQRLDVLTDPMEPGYYVEPWNLFKFSELYMRHFPEDDNEGKPLADQTQPAP
jgi:hypothetical protein